MLQVYTTIFHPPLLFKDNFSSYRYDKDRQIELFFKTSIHGGGGALANPCGYKEDTHEHSVSVYGMLWFYLYPSTLLASIASILRIMYYSYIRKKLRNQGGQMWKTISCQRGWEGRLCALGLDRRSSTVHSDACLQRMPGNLTPEEESRAQPSCDVGLWLGKV